VSGLASLVVTLFAAALLVSPAGAETPWEVFVVGQPLPNRANDNNPEVDQLLVQARRIADRGRRAELYRKAQRLIVEDAPMVFVDHEVQVVATRAGVKGFRLHPSGFDLRVEHVTKE